MPRNRNSKTSQCDFDTGGQNPDKHSPLRLSQNRLYKLNNPYVGSKRGILPDIADSFDRHGIKFNSMLDLFGGSGVVSIFFKLLGKQVISNDLLTSSYYNALAFVENESIALTVEQIDYLCHNNNPNKRSWAQDNYIDRFTSQEAQFIDTYRANIDSLVDRLYQDSLNLQNSLSITQKFTPIELMAQLDVKMRQNEIIRALATVLIEHYIMNRCFLGGRLNHGQILAEVEHRIQHDRNSGETMKFQMEPLPQFFDGAKNCKAYNSDAIDTIKKVRVDYPNVGMAYLDPPYGQSQSNYSNMYQFCEEFIYQKPLAELPHLQDAAKKFAKAKHYQDHFREVLDGLDFVPIWAVSFNAESFESAKNIEKILKDYKKSVITINIDHEYRYRKTRSSAIEYLFIAR